MYVYLGSPRRVGENILIPASSPFGLFLMKVKGGSLKFGKSGVWSWTVNAIIHTFLAALWWRSTSWVISRSSKGRKVTATQRFSPGALRGYGIPVTDPSKSDRWCWRAMGTCLRAKRTHWRDALARGACHMIVIHFRADANRSRVIKRVIITCCTFTVRSFNLHI